MQEKITIDKSGANTAAIKRRTRPMLKSFWSAATTLAGIELMHIIRKGQPKGRAKLHPAQQFYSLAA